MAHPFDEQTDDIGPDDGSLHSALLRDDPPKGLNKRQRRRFSEAARDFRDAFESGQPMGPDDY